MILQEKDSHIQVCSTACFSGQFRI
jgi:hypothetical protein